MHLSFAYVYARWVLTVVKFCRLCSWLTLTALYVGQHVGRREEAACPQHLMLVQNSTDRNVQERQGNTRVARAAETSTDDTQQSILPINLNDRTHEDWLASSTLSCICARVEVLARLLER